jgi:hypothetical protein
MAQNEMRAMGRMPLCVRLQSTVLGPCGLTFDMSGQPRACSRALGCPLDGGVRRHCWSAWVRCSALHRQPGHRSDAKCAASDSISALLRLAKSGSGFAAVPCDRVPPRISCNDQTV